jgi:hypothetical protein
MGDLIISTCGKKSWEDRIWLVVQRTPNFLYCFRDGKIERLGFSIVRRI